VHSLGTGTQRYLSAAGYAKEGELKMQSGKFYASRKRKATGAYCDQSVAYPLYADEKAQDAVYDTLRRFVNI
jgi:hypothetical protein